MNSATHGTHQQPLQPDGARQEPKISPQNCYQIFAALTIYLIDQKTFFCFPAVPKWHSFAAPKPTLAERRPAGP
jgi:hypothetical protein